MAGHSKWANIKFRKAAQDAKRGKIFTKLIKEITVAARVGGADTAANPRLRSAVDKALAANMTRDAITRAVNRGDGGGDGAAIEEIRYEGYGPHGVAVLVECATDNRNRAAGEVRNAFSKHGGNLGTDGSVAYLFEKIGSLVFAAGADEERIMEIALQAGASGGAAAAFFASRARVARIRADSGDGGIDSARLPAHRIARRAGRAGNQIDRRAGATR